MTPFLLLAAAVLLVALGGLMAALDAALSVTSRSDLDDWAAEDLRRGGALRRIGEDIPGHINAVTFLRILAETTAAVLVTVSFTLFFENIWWAMLATALLMTVISFALVGASPRAVGRQHATGLLRGAAGVVRFARILIGPVAHLLVVVGNRVTPGVTKGASFSSEEQLLSMVDEAASRDLIEEDDRELIHSVFDFTDTVVRSVMVPRTEIVSIEHTATAGEAMELFLERGTSRMPVIDREADDVVGMLYLKDVVRNAFASEGGWQDRAVPALARRVVFVPESMKAESLLQQMKRDRIHVCIAVDEYGGVAGLVTMEDLIEEIVGDISDEYDPRAAGAVEVEPGRYRVSASMPLDEVGELFGIEIEDDDVESIGGLLAKALGQVPVPGSTAVTHGVTITGERSRGRGRGLATALVERAEPDPVTGEQRIVREDGEHA